MSEPSTGTDVEKVGQESGWDTVAIPLLLDGTAPGHEVLAPLHTSERETGPEFIVPTIESAEEMLELFKQHLGKLNLEYELSTVIDLLAAALSSQFVLLAGPSGTGKSSAASALSAFFASPEAAFTIYARTQLVGPEDLVGYASGFGAGYVRGPDLGGLWQIGRPSENATPFLVVEEANLSPLEGYLSPFIHGLSAPYTASVNWKVHDHKDDHTFGAPGELVFSPYPRLLGTINVDATAHPPAPKVTARACVVLLEPPQFVSAMDSSQTALNDLIANDSQSESGIGGGFIGDPRAVLKSEAIPFQPMHAALQLLLEQVEARTKSKTAEALVLSHRQYSQIVLYSSWFCLITHHVLEESTPEAQAQLARLAVENAFLHFVLPSLPGTLLASVLEPLRSIGQEDRGPSDLAFSSVLASRCDRLLAATTDEELSLGVLDFWDRLS